MEVKTSNSYVYVHYKSSDGTPFYVGKGSTGYRHTSKASRNKHWHFIVNKHGFYAAKVVENVDDELAYLSEIELIDKYKKLGFSLANKTEGGEGHKGLKVRLGIKVSEETKEKLRQINTGKKQSQETIRKRMETFKKNGFVLGGAKGYGVNSTIFSGYYITPLGKFATLNDVAKAHNISFNQARKRINGKKYKVGNKIYEYPPMAGYYFEPKE